MKVQEALVEVMQAVPAVPKADRNEAQNFSFRGIDAVLNAVGPALRDVGVVVFPYVLEQHAEIIHVGRNQTPMQSVVLLVRYTFVGPEGDTLQVVVPGQAADAGDKAYSKAMSVALRTALIQTFALPTDEPDPDQDVYERSRAGLGTPVHIQATEADLARDDLMVVVQKYGLKTAEVAKQYLGVHKSYLHEETNARRIREFTEEVERDCMSEEVSTSPTP